MLEINFADKHISVGPVVKSERKKQSLKQKYVAYEAGISTSYLSEIESSLRVPSFAILKRICQVLDINVHQLLYQVQKNIGIDEECLKDDFKELEKELEAMRKVLYESKNTKSRVKPQKMSAAAIH